ncbi:MAG: DNA polymerase III subunit alpha [Pseudomonadota bacterium]
MRDTSDKFRAGEARVGAKSAALMVAEVQQLPTAATRTPASFVHLHLHTQYSIVDGLVKVPDLMQAVAAADMPAVALSDAGNLFAMVKFYTRALREGIKPIIGVEVSMRDEDQVSGEPTLMVLLCMDVDGYRNLTRLVTRAFQEGQRKGRPEVSRGWLTPSACEGLIALSGGFEGELAHLAQSSEPASVAAALQHWCSVFPDRFYLQVSRTGRAEEAAWLDAAVRMGHDINVPLVATNDVRFLESGEFEAHEARVCIHQGRTLADSKRPKPYTPHQYLRTPEEMIELFQDLPEAIENSLHIAARCSLDLELGKSYLPEFPVPDGSDAETWLCKQSREKLESKLERLQPTEISVDDYKARLERELNTICDMGFPGYFLIVADFIEWARNNGVPVGPGRGSGAGSLVAFVLGITDIDPLEHDLLFERFLNPERVSMPDFDVDFCMEGRDRVIAYVAEHYGRHRVSQIITYGTMAAKAVVRDAGRVLDFPYGFVDRIAKLIPFEVGMTLNKALDDEPELARLYREDDEVKSILELALSLEGCVRNAGKHAGGVVIAPTELTDFTPLYCEEGGANLVTQFDKDDVEAAGLVKFDFLGLRTLTIIDRALQSVNAALQKQGKEPIDLQSLPMDDEATFALLQRCQTTAVFQLESRGMKDLIKRLRPDCFGDLVALVALFRPGPLQSGMVDDFIARKHGQGGQDIDYLHPDLKPVLEPTYGVILYQEQVMQIAQVLAGYTLGGADLLRRAMGKKKPEEMAKQRQIFVDGCVERNVDKAQAEYIFDLMEKFAGYGFNKSHSAAYAVLSYQTAWLKAHYPAEFMAAVMSSDMDSTDKLVGLKDDCRSIGIQLLAPDINASQASFTATPEADIRYGLGAIKGVGLGAIDALVAERSAGGPFKDLPEVLQRVDLEPFNRRMFEALIKAGALDSLGANRRAMIETVPDLLRQAEQDARAAAAGQNDLFGAETTDAAIPSIAIRDVAEWHSGDKLRAEKEALGLYLSGHPFTRYRQITSQLARASLGEIVSARPPAGAESGGDYAQPKRQVTVAGLIFDIRKRGNRTTVTLDDDTGRIDVQLYSETVDAVRHLLVKDSVVAASGNLTWDSFMNAWCVNARSLRDVDHMVEEYAAKLVLSFARPESDAEARERVRELQDVLRPHRGGACEIVIDYRAGELAGQVALGELWRVRVSASLRDSLDQSFGEGSYAIKLAHA